MIRATIAFAVGFALAPRWAAAAEPNALPPPEPAEGASTSDSREAPAARAGATPAVSGLPDQPFGEDAVGAARSSASASADDAESEDTEDEAPGAPLRALSCLEGEGGNDQDGSRRGVQKRDFQKKHRFEIAALGGDYASDALSSTYVYGGALSFFFSEDFGVEAMVLRNPVAFRLEEPFTVFTGEQHFQSGVAWNVLGAMLWAPVHAKLRFSDRHITHADLLLIAGAGQTINDTARGLTFQAGIGLKLYLARFVSLRIDVRDLIVPQEVLGSGRNTHNLVTMVGLCAWVPG